MMYGSCRFRSAVAALFLTALTAGGTAAQSARPLPALLVLDVELSLAGATIVTQPDRAWGERADMLLGSELARGGSYRLVPAGHGSDGAEPAAAPDGRSCDVSCAVERGAAAGAERVLVTRLTKLSPAIWILTAHLVSVPDGKVVHSEEMELKGRMEEMVPAGIASLARRMSGVP